MYGGAANFWALPPRPPYESYTNIVTQLPTYRQPGRLRTVLIIIISRSSAEAPQQNTFKARNVHEVSKMK